MLERTRARMKERYEAARQRETRFLMSFDIVTVNTKLLILLSVFSVLNFMDALTTLIAIRTGPHFVELNAIASGLFRMDFPGFVAAMALKYIPFVPLAYATFLPADGGHAMARRIVKVSAFVVLVAADLFYLAVVGSNSISLARYYLQA
jgi:hypothetical protein